MKQEGVHIMIVHIHMPPDSNVADEDVGIPAQNKCYL